MCRHACTFALRTDCTGFCDSEILLLLFSNRDKERERHTHTHTHTHTDREKKTVPGTGKNESVEELSRTLRALNTSYSEASL